MGVNRLMMEVESEYSIVEDFNILGWFKHLNKITFFGVYSKMVEKRIFLIFVDLELNLCKASQSAHVFTSCARIFARIFMKIWLVVKYYLMNISFKFHKDQSTLYH